MTTAEIILKVRKKLPLLLLLAAGIYGLSYFILMRFAVQYKSETSFYINEGIVMDMARNSIDPKELNVLTTMACNRVLLLMSSDELRDSLVSDYHLYQHYGIDTLDPFAHEKVMLALNQNIIIRRDAVTVNLVHLTVDDKDRIVAANMANRIVERINVMNREILKRDMRRRITKYEAVLSSLKLKETGERKEFLTFIDSISPTYDKITDDAMTPIQNKLMAYDLFGKIDKNSAKYDQVLEEYYNIMGSIGTTGDNEWQTVTIIQKALPDINSGRRQVLSQAAAASFLSFFLFLSIMIYFLQNDKDANLFLLALKGKTKHDSSIPADSSNTLPPLSGQNAAATSQVSP